MFVRHISYACTFVVVLLYYCSLFQRICLTCVQNVIIISNIYFLKCVRCWVFAPLSWMELLAAHTHAHTRTAREVKDLFGRCLGHQEVHRNATLSSWVFVLWQSSKQMPPTFDDWLSTCLGRGHFGYEFGFLWYKDLCAL